MMPVMCVSAVLLCSMVADISARGLTATSTVDQPTLSARQYQHTDPNSGTRLACDKCPAGTYVSTHCSPSSVRECTPCPAGTFTRGENGVQQCHRCRAPCPVGFTEKVPCTTTQDRVCACPPNSFSSGGVDGGCKPHSLCPPGTRVKKRGTQTEDVLCRPCTKGTFSNVKSRTTKCRNHTDCQALGLVLLKPGTKETDNVCGSPSTIPPLFSPSSSFGPEHAALKQEPVSSTLTSLIYGAAHKGTFSQLASLQQKSWSGEDQKSEGGLLNEPNTPTPPNQDPPWTLLTSAHKQPKDWEPKFEQESSISRLGKQAMEGLESSETGRAGISKTAGQGNGGGVSNYYRPTHRGSPRPTIHDHFDINEHLPWMIVLLLLLVLVVIVVCSVKRSSRVLKKGPMQDPSSIMEKSIQKKSSAPPTQVREKWIYCCNGQGVDILKLVAAQVGAQWIDIYQSLANATEREVAAFSNGYSSDHERAYAALQHWTIRDSDANLAKLINALHRQRRIDVVEKIRCVMEDNPQFDTNQLMTSVNVSHSLSPIHKPLESPTSVGSSGSVGRVSSTGMEQSPIDRTKGFFPDESEPLLRCDSTSSKDSALSRNGSFITKEKKDTVLRQVRLDPCDLQPIFDDMLHILHPEELHILEKIPAAEDKLDQLFEIAGTKSQEASQTLLDSVYSHLPDLL
ncbi:tumor necrosis factor receptor superfamily member 21 [Oryzias melastigma]|uniref:Tumor necrosis factor receptor superfamily, member 21 n=1 Tax=Oryzias melastigma TaxID=30732 RepID=A0A3B3C2D6_ORYME|nr:tumor necrosis factor receptor superfamily member 21 [Oryzias melastigma]